jgi:hypothetical protein
MRKSMCQLQVICKLYISPFTDAITSACWKWLLHSEWHKKLVEGLSEFINIYKLEMCLFKIKSKWYSNGNLKTPAYENKINFVKKVYWEENREWIENRIQSLHGSFHKELKERVLESIKYTSTDTIHVPSLWYYDLLFSHEIRGVREKHQSYKRMKNENVIVLYTVVIILQKFQMNGNPPHLQAEKENKWFCLVPFHHRWQTVICNCFSNTFLEGVALSFPVSLVMEWLVRIACERMCV